MSATGQAPVSLDSLAVQLAQVTPAIGQHSLPPTASRQCRCYDKSLRRMIRKLTSISSIKFSILACNSSPFLSSLARRLAKVPRGSSAIALAPTLRADSCAKNESRSSSALVLRGVGGLMLTCALP